MEYVLREALSNVEKHANASTVRVELALADGAVRVTVTDDGRGFEVGALDDDGATTGSWECESGWPTPAAISPSTAPPGRGRRSPRWSPAAERPPSQGRADGCVPAASAGAGGSPIRGNRALTARRRAQDTRRATPPLYRWTGGGGSLLFVSARVLPAPLDKGRGAPLGYPCGATANRGRRMPALDKPSRLNRVVQSRNRAKNPPTPQNREASTSGTGSPQTKKPHVCGGSPSGASRARTGDLLHAMQASGSPDFGVSAGHSLPPAVGLAAAVCAEFPSISDRTGPRKASLAWSLAPRLGGRWTSCLEPP